MNRLTSSNASSKPQLHPQGSVALAGPRRSRDQGSFDYHLLAPIHYEPNYSYPLVVWLHSAGDNEYQLRRIMHHVSLRNYVAVGPRGPIADRNSRSYGWSADMESPEAAWHNVHQALEIATQQYNVHPERIFLGGLYDGGTMALRLALREPERFAGVFSIGGPFPQNCGALGRFNAVRDLPLLILRGMESEVYPEAVMCDEIRLFHAAHMQVHLRQYPCGDDLTVPMLRDVDAWLMEQVTGMPVLSESDATA